MKHLLILALLVLPTVSQAQTVTGSLGEGDATREGGIYYDATTFTIDKARKVTIRMTSSDFDTYLILRSPSGQETINDDFDGQQVSQIEMWATETGTWTVWASMYAADASGDYEMTLDLGLEAEVVVVQGRLDYQDQQALKGEFYDTHTREIHPDATVLIELLSLGFDGYLVVTGPDGHALRNDDAGSTQVSRVGPVQGGGKWTVQVTSVSEGETGAYDLKYIYLPEKM